MSHARKKKSSKALLIAICVISCIAIVFASISLAEKSESKKDIKEIASKNVAVSKPDALPLYWLSESGNETAQLLYGLLFEGAPLEKSNVPDYDRLSLINIVSSEARYVAVNNAIDSYSKPMVIDLVCQYTPRGLDISNESTIYFGLDSRSVIDKMNSIAIAQGYSKFPNMIRYYVVDITKEDSLDLIEKKIIDDLCIVCEGVFMDADSADSEAILRNVSKLLEEHGGCFVTTDFVFDEYFDIIAAALYGDTDAIVLSSENRLLYPDMNRKGISDEIMSSYDCKKMFENAGLKYEQVTAFESAQELSCFKLLDKEQVESIKSQMKNLKIWVITLDE